MASQRLAAVTQCSGVTYLPREMHRSVRAGEFPVSLFVISLISAYLFICLSLLPLFILSCSLLLASFCLVIDSCGALRRLSKRIEPRYILLHLMWQLLYHYSLSYPCYFAYDLLFFFRLSIYPRVSLLVNLPCYFYPFMIHLVNCNWVDTRWQQYSTHLHTNSTQNNTMKHNTQNGTYITIRIHKHKNKIHKHNNFFSPGATTPIGGCILQPCSRL